KFLSLVIFAYLQISYCYNTSISHKTYAKCDKESVIGPGSSYVTSYMKFQEFVPIQSLVYGKGSTETRIKFYFQGRSHFGVGFLAQSKEPPKTNLFLISKLAVHLIQAISDHIFF
uniref:Farnesoic acid O-methyl transferase domain-containing protein n=1 Tax=Megaselia scalaris TaxID=36166 RepID=T1GU54_MEGSC